MPKAIHIPAQPSERPCPNLIIAEGLQNPRGISLQADGSLLLAEAGSGQADAPFSGRISRLRPSPDTPGVYMAPEVIADGYRSMNMQSRMMRDEIMGLSDVVCADGRCLASLTDYVEGSRILNLQHAPPRPIFHSQGNVNALCYHPARRNWLAVKPDSNHLVEFTADQGERVIAHLPELDQGQEAVPVTLMYEPASDAVLISLFSGELHRDPARRGIDFADRAGQVIRLWPDTGHIDVLIRGLQLPTGLAWGPEGQVLVLELCDRVLQPLPQEWPGEALHGGFARFSGRLLGCDLQTGDVTVLASGLDTPSNLCRSPDAVLVSEGMGIPGRLLPGAEGKTVPLSGRIRRVQLR